MDWQTNEGQTGSAKIYLVIQKAGLDIAAIDFGDAENPDIDGIQPGESGEVYLTVSNTGNEAVMAGELDFALGNCVEVISSQIPTFDLAAGETKRLDTPVNVTVSAACQNGQLGDFISNLTYNSLIQPVTVMASTQFPIGLLVDVFQDNTEIALEIPDDADPVEFTFDWERAGLIKDVGITIELTHTYIGDLTVKLVHPDGTEVMLHNMAGSSDDDINRTYGRGGDSLDALNTLVGKAAEGTWKVVIQDHASQDTGTLNRVNLNLAGYFAD